MVTRYTAAVTCSKRRTSSSAHDATSRSADPVPAGCGRAARARRNPRRSQPGLAVPHGPAKLRRALGLGEPAGASGEAVDVPHSWNIGKHHAYLGVAWYFRTFELPALPADAHVELNFGATFYSARVWLNGEEIGKHEGGFTAYSFDITKQLARHELPRRGDRQSSRHRDDSRATARAASRRPGTTGGPTAASCATSG